MEIVLAIILIVAALALVVTIMLQSGGKSGKLSQSIAGGSSENYAGKNKQRFKDRKLSRWTTYIAIIFVVLLLVTYILLVHTAKKKDSADDTTASTDTTAASAESTTAGESGESSDETTENGTGENEIDFGELTGDDKSTDPVSAAE